MLKVLTVFGTRPEAIKLAPVIQELQRRSDVIRGVVCVTGQHREMLDQVLSVFAIKPDYDLGVMKEQQGLAELTANIMSPLERVLDRERPDVVLVQGDTSTVFLSALLSFYRRILVAHVEAGLRTGDRYAPFPEEINRRLTSVLATLHFAPTEGARQALLKEGVPEGFILVTGNTVVDAFQFILKREPPIPLALPTGKRVVLITAHRRENLGQPLENICLAIRDLARANPRVEFVYPVHLNPVVQECARRVLGGQPGVRLVEPLDYLTFVHLMARSHFVITDSGGIQEEAPILGKPVLVLRDVTERPEAVAWGNTQMVGTKRDVIVAAAQALLDSEAEYARRARVGSPFGDGQAARRIVEALLVRPDLSPSRASR